MNTKNTNKKKYCVIYVRVSSRRQVEDGHGLDAQERRCRDWATQNGYVVAKVFIESGVSGGIFERPKLKEMFHYLGKNKQISLVLFEDITRIARNVDVHLEIAKTLYLLKVEYQTVNQKIDKTSTGKFIERALANFAELFKDLNRENVINKTKARLEAGYWAFGALAGYKMKKEPAHGMILRRDEPKATIIQEALEGFASGVFVNQTAVAHFLRSKEYSKHASVETVRRLLDYAIIYAGYIEYPKWNISQRKGHHDPLISYQTYQKIYNHLHGTPRGFERRDQNEDFPARGFVVCASCKHPFTASWSKGRRKKYPYYRCQTTGCEWHNKSIKREDVENGLLKIIKKSQPNAGTLKLGELVLRDLWDNKTSILESRLGIIERQSGSYEIEKKRIIELIKKAKNDQIVSIYEEELKEIQNKIKKLEFEVDEYSSGNFNFETTWKEARKFLENPYAKWKNGDFEEKRMVLRLVFREKVEYNKIYGYGTAQYSLPIEIFGKKYSSNSQLVDMGGIEPP